MSNGLVPAAEGAAHKIYSYRFCTGGWWYPFSKTYVYPCAWVPRAGLGVGSPGGVGGRGKRGGGDSLKWKILVCWLVGFLVPWSLVSWFSVSWFQGFLVSKFQSFRNRFNVQLEDLVPYYKISISCFSRNTDPISKGVNKYIRRIVGICRCASFPKNKMLNSIVEIHRKTVFA